jgi:hypothetical protein
MKRLLILIALSIPTLASAQTKLSETWSTYCDGSSELVRMTLTLHTGDVGFVGGELAVFNSPDCSGPPGWSASSPARVDLGGGDFAFVWDGLPRTSLPGASVSRHGSVVLSAPDGMGGSITHFYYFECSDGAQAVVDNSECSTLPVASKTWGAIKALYR